MAVCTACKPNISDRQGTGVSNSAMEKNANDPSYFGTQYISKILIHLAPPVMLALLIQALYNIVDSFFIGRYSEQGLTALSVVYPIQIVTTALAVGTGVGVNTLMARYYAEHQKEKANDTAGSGAVIAVILWLLFAIASSLIMRPLVRLTTSDEASVQYACTYGLIVCIGSLGTFLESIFSKVHQAEGNMMLPMIAQVAGALCNIALDPILIFGCGFVPAMGVAGAAYATVCGQVLAAVITGIRGFRRPPAFKRIAVYAKGIFKLGYPSILMQSLYTIYIFALNFILAGFCDEAVTVLGLYYKVQSFFFIPLNGLQTCIVPILSYNYTTARYDRVRLTLRYSVLITAAFMLVGTLCFEFIPAELLGLFSQSEKVLEIGSTAFRIIGTSFVPATFSLMLPIFFQAIGKGAPSVLLTLSRQIFCLIPIFFAFSFVGLPYTWIAFPAAELITGGIGILLYTKQVRYWKLEQL